MEGSGRVTLVAGNWKMYKTPDEAAAFASLLREKVVPGGVEVVVCPSFPAIPAVARVLAGSAIGWGAQNMHWAPEGAYTGEVSAPMLCALGCRYVILGHSERRKHFGESDEMIRMKLEAALSCGLRPIFCLGEDLAAREAGEAEAFCLRQLRAGLAGLRIEDPAGLVVAYEPVWAIGTGKTATPADAAAVVRVLRQELGRLFGASFAGRVRFLYGGSMTPEHIVPFMEEEEIDGVLVGGASLKVDSFVEIIRGAAVARGQTV